MSQGAEDKAMNRQQAMSVTREPEKNQLEWRGLRKGLLMLNATQVDTYWKIDTMKTEVFSKLRFALGP